MKNLNEHFGQLNIWNLGAREEPLGQTGWGPCLSRAPSLPMRTNAGDVRDAGSIPGLGRSPGGGGNGNPLVFLPGESHGQRRLVGYGPWGRKELDTTEAT